MLHRILSVATAATLVLAAPAWAQATRATDALLDQLGLPDTVAVMRQEGLDYGAELAEEMLPDGGGASWQAVVRRIYDSARMEETVRNGFARAWAEEKQPLAAIEAFFASDTGQQVVQLEISAREAMIDPGVEEAARTAYRDSEDSGDPRLALIAEFIAANDLVDANVVGAMNSSYAFYAGLVDGGGFEMSEEEILALVWGSEAETRDDSREWLYSYMVLAYRPLEEAALRSYVEMASSREGRALNRALFAGFDQMYGEISYALGLALARQMTAQDL